MRNPSEGGRLCERARQWASLRLDGELSHLEQALLDAHLRRCAGCREFERAASALSSYLRQSPVEQLERPVRLPVRQRVVTPLRLGAAAAAAVTVIAVSSMLGTLNSHSLPPISVRPDEANINEDLELRRLRSSWLKRHPAVARGIRVRELG